MTTPEPTDDDDVTFSETSTVRTAPHEFSVNYLYAQEGLRPFFAADRRIKDGDGKQVSEFEIGAERWVVKLYYQDSGIVHPGDDGNGNVQPGATNPQGTEFRIEELREFRLKVARHPDEDEVGEQSFNAHLAPRWQGMQVENDKGERSEYSVPDGISEAVNISVKGSNIEFDRYEELLCRGFESVDIRRTYFERPHDYSNIQDAERYVRIDEDASGPIHGRDGPIASMAHLLEDDRTGYRKLVQNDNDGHGNNVPGYYHTVTLGPARIGEAFPSHQLPKEIKHYYAREAASKPDDNPLSHPKLGASYQVNRWNGKLGVDEIETLNDELDQAVLSVIADAGLQVHPSDGGPFVPDAYFDAAAIEREDDPIVSLDMTQIKQRQESVVIQHISDGLSPVEWDSLETLVTDGGEVSPNQIAEENDRHPDSVRRALGRIEDLVEREYDRVSLKSSYVADLVHDAVKSAEDAVQRAAETGAKAIEAAERGLDEGTSALVAWASRHDVDLNQTGDGYVEIDFGTMEADEISEINRKIKRALRHGVELWEDAGQNPAHFIGGSYRVTACFDKYPDRTHLSEETYQSMGGPIGSQIHR